MFPIGIHAQIVLESVEPQYSIAYNFFGADYQVSNVSFVGDPIALSQFDGTNSNLGLEKGIVICTGDCSIAYGPNTVGDSWTDIPFDHPAGPLSFAAIGPKYDVAYLEFDLVPSVDSLLFRYVFASEEYEEYVNSSTFGDAHVIKISGPGIIGNENLMVLPNGDLVNIHQVHGPVANEFGTFAPSNPDYYVDNPPSTNSSDFTEIGFDGFTKQTIAKVTNLNIGSTYHIIIGVADVYDPINDSAIFIEACETCDYTLNTENSNQAEFQAFPNPISSDILNVRSEGQHTYTLVDVTGQIVLTGDFQNEKDLDISRLSNGAYVLRLENGAVQRIIKQ